MPTPKITPDVEEELLYKLTDLLTADRPPGGRRTNDGPAEVTDHLFVGSALDAVNRRLLNSLRITHVLNCTTAETIRDYGDVGFCSPSSDRNYRQPKIHSANNNCQSTDDVEFNRFLSEKHQLHAKSGHGSKSELSHRSQSVTRHKSIGLDSNTMKHESQREASDWYLASHLHSKPHSSSVSVTGRSGSRPLARSDSLWTSSAFRNRLPSSSRFERISCPSYSNLCSPIERKSSWSSFVDLRSASGYSGTKSCSPCFSEQPESRLMYSQYSFDDVDPIDVTVQRGIDGSPYDPTRSTVRSYLEINADDRPGYPLLHRHYPAARKFIDSAQASGGRALIHCELGINRSVTLALAYLVDTERVALTQAVRQLRIARPNMLRNEGFRRQLVKFATERELADCNQIKCLSTNVSDGTE